MTHTRPLYAGLLCWALLGFPTSAVMSGPSVVHADEALRPEVGKPLKDAAAMLKSGKYREALGKIHDADAVGGKNAAETFMIERMRFAASMGAGDTAQALKSFEALQASGRLPAAEKLADIENLVSVYYRAKDYSAASTWANRYAKEGGTDPRITGLGPQLRYQSGDYAGVVKEILPRAQAAEKAGRNISEEELQLLANCYLKLKDESGYIYSMERLVAGYPKKSYWTDLIIRVKSKQGFSGRLALDLYRIKLATDNMNSAGEYMEMAELALVENFNTEGKTIVDQAYAKGAFGQGPEAARQKRMADLIAKRLVDEPKTLAQEEKDANAAADGTALINLGLNYVTAGKAAKGLPFVEAGLKKDNFKRPDDAKLRAGIAYAMAGQKSKANQTLKSVAGNDGTADMAKLWMLRAQQ